MTSPWARLLALAFLILCPAPSRAAELIVDAASDYIVEARINGHPVRLRVDPETSGYIVLNPATVERIGLRRSMLGSQTRIGPVRLTGSSKVAEVTIGDVTGDRRLVWIDRPAVEAADGLIGPSDMHFDRVTFRIGPESAGHDAVALPMEFERSYGLFFPMIIGEETIRFQFSLIKPAGMATAAAGAQIAALHGGAWSGEAHERLIEFGVIRPVRPLALSQPLALNGFELAAMLVRTGDNRGNLDLPPEPDADPDEVVITGSTRRRQRPRYNVTLGLDRLSACSSLVWEKASRQMILNCPRADLR